MGAVCFCGRLIIAPTNDNHPYDNRPYELGSTMTQMLYLINLYRVARLWHGEISPFIPSGWSL